MSIPDTLNYRQAAMCTQLELSGGYSAATLDLLDNGNNLLKERVRLVKTVDLGDDILRGVLLEDLGQLDGFLVALDVLEAVRLLDGAEKSIDLVAALSQLSSGADKALFAGELAERSTTDTLDIVLEDRV